MDKKELALYALLDLGIEMENDKILDIVIAGLNDNELEDYFDYCRALRGQRIFNEMLSEEFDSNQLEFNFEESKEWSRHVG